MSKSFVVALALMALWVAPARGAQPPGPSKVSQLVTLQPDPFFGTPPCEGLEAPLNRVVQPDLSEAPLTIPDGHVLVLMGGTWEQAAIGNPPDRDVSLRLFLKDGRGGVAALAWVGAAARTDAEGKASGAFRLDPGVVVRPGQTVCAVFDVGLAEKGGAVFGFGYLAKDE